MKKLIFTIVIQMFIVQCCFGQLSTVDDTESANDNFEISVNRTVYNTVIERRVVNTQSIFVTITNKSEQELFVFFDRERKILDDSVFIHKRFFTKEKDGYSLYLWAFEGNIESWAVDLYYSFLKRIRPNESFMFVTLGNEEMEKELIDQIRIISLQQLVDIRHGLGRFKDLDTWLFQIPDQLYINPAEFSISVSN